MENATTVWELGPGENGTWMSFPVSTMEVYSFTLPRNHQMTGLKLMLTKPEKNRDQGQGWEGIKLPGVRSLGAKV